MISFQEMRDKSRYGPFALMDFAITIVVIIIIWMVFVMTNIFLGSGKWLLFLLVLSIPLSIVAHLIFKQDTPLTKMFLDTSFHYSSILTKIIFVLSILILAIL